ncbi:MAG: hypothetical protein A2Y80_07965 [Deltaproteobacteria bacterium RBG_13_58_19]|nr:MAG: hypothetical protein A2Y80_07965 [Deltaproteobacteria bacterium RBG_13_58_19]
MSAPKVLIWESLGILAGGQKVALQIAQALGERHHCLFFLPEEGPLAAALKEEGLPYHLLPIGHYSVGSKGLRDCARYVSKTPYILVRAARLLRREKVGLIYVNGARNFLWAALLGKALGLPVIWHVHNFFQERQARRLIRAAGALKSVKKIVFVSQAVQRPFSSLAAKSLVIPNGLDHAGFLGAAGMGPGIREELSLPADRQLIAHIGWIMPSKNQEALVRAIPLIIKEQPWSHFLFIGGVRNGYAGYFQKLQALVKALGIEDNTTFTGHRPDVPRIFPDLSLHVITSEEAFPLALLEAWAAGVPTVGPNLGVIPEMMEPGKTGLVYDPRHPQDLAARIVTLLADASLWREISRHSRAKAQEFDIRAFNAKITSLVETTLSCASC